MECKRIQVNTREYTGNVGDFNGKRIVELRKTGIMRNHGEVLDTL